MTNRLFPSSLRCWSFPGIVAGLGLTVLVVLGPAVEADIITVGANGDWRHLHDAVDAALDTPGTDEIHIEGPITLRDSVEIPVNLATGDLEISGGWNADFSHQTRDPSLTVLDGDGARVMWVQALDGAVFTIDNLTIQGGAGVSVGAGLLILTENAAEVFVYDVWFLDNSASSTGGSVNGGALYLYLEDSYAEVSGNQFLHNLVRIPSSAPDQVTAGGAALWATLEGSHLSFSDNFLNDNGCTRTNPTGTARGCAIHVESALDSSLEMTGNSVAHSFVNGFESAPGVGAYIYCDDSVTLMERNRWRLAWTSVVGQEPSFVELWSRLGCELTQRSSVISGSSDIGLKIEAYAAEWNGVNLTVADNGSDGLVIDNYSTGGTSLSNTISYDNGGSDLDLAPGTSIVQHANLIGVDPHFVNSSQGNYRLLSDSPGIDTGDNAPPGELSALDLENLPRVQGPSVDIGAHEGTTWVFADDFETGDTSHWSAVEP